MPGLDSVQSNICGMNTLFSSSWCIADFLLCFVEQEFHVLGHGWKKMDEGLEKTKPRIHLSWV